MNRQSMSLAAVLVSLPIVAAGQTAPDTSEWECDSCAFPDGLYLDIDAGVGFVSDDDAYRFGDYRGFDDDSAIFIGGFDMDYWTDSGGYWKATGRDLGLDSRSLSLGGGRQGLYNIDLFYRNLPRQLFNTTLTPFSGFDTLSLPSTWVTSGSPAAMTQLNSSLMPVEIGHDRETLGFGLTFHPSTNLQYQLDYRHDERDGKRMRGASFLTQSALLPEPVDYSTDQVDASISYAGSRGQIAVNYYASLFNSKAQALTWDNPFTPFVSGATRGRIALPPDNQAHQLSLSGSYRLTDKTRLAATMAAGSLKQDELFLPFTINPSLTGTSLPAATLDGKVKTRKYNLRLTGRPDPKLRLQAEFDADDRDNQTPRNDYAVVESDVYSSGLRTNVPYSFQRTRFGVKGDYRLDRAVTLSSGYRYREIERDYQEVVDTDEQSTWFGVRIRPRDDNKVMEASVKFGHDEREGANYTMPDDPVTAQNPLLRKYNLADRDRDFVRVSVSATPTERVDVGLNFETADEDYESTTLGLLYSDSQRIDLDASVRLSDKAFVTLFYGRETIESEQNGSAAFGVPDWSAMVDDEIDTFSFGLRLPQLKDKFDVTLDYISSDASGRIGLIQTGSGLSDSFPELSTRLSSARLYADYQPDERYQVRFGYYYERLKTRDWALDGIAPDTLSSVLTLGAQSPNYTGGIFSLSFRYSLANGTQ